MRLHYTHHAQEMLIKRAIEQQWVEHAFSHPDKTENDPLDKAVVHYLKCISENGDRILRVIVNVDVNPNAVVTAFFDRSLKGKL